MAENNTPVVTARDGLLWRDGKYIPLPEADYVATANGYTCAEQMVRALEAPERTPVARAPQPIK